MAPVGPWAESAALLTSAAACSCPRANPRAATTMAPPPPPPPLMAELVEEILLRFPPQEPASLVRAALVSKRWCCLISGPGFRRRFREFHCTPPMRGFLLDDMDDPSRFVPTTAICSRHAGTDPWVALDARHGRVLLWEDREEVLVVWDPITDEQKALPIPPRKALSWAAAILCSAGGGTCDHLDCHRGPFLVVFVGSDEWTTFVYTYSSDVDAWSEIVSSTTRSTPGEFYVDSEYTALVGNALYFGGHMENMILKYTLESREMSWIQIPDECPEWQRFVLTATEEARLRLITVIDSKLYMWSRKDGHEVDAGWARSRVIELKTLLPFGAVFTTPCVAGFADGLGTVFVEFDKLLYAIDLKSYDVKKLCQTRDRGTNVVPYMSFYIPALEAACSGEESSAGGSSA